jgi:cyclopropane fatty-acyl-phospholipid synthase-like methyltransferase
MLFTWNADTIRWYLNANEYSGFYNKIAATVAPGLSGYRSLCDFGCGLGLFDFAVSSLFETIECVDINETALASINERAALSGITNITTRLNDCYQISGAWDVAYMSFFGSRELDTFLPMCKKLIAVVATTSESEMFPMKHKRYQKNTVSGSEKYLKEKHIPYKLTLKQLEFGQPFTSVDDARRCVRSYVPEISETELEEYLKRRLKETRGEVYPYFIPRTKSFGIFEIDGLRR